jgi:hypothetical protein
MDGNKYEYEYEYEHFEDKKTIVTVTGTIPKIFLFILLKFMF